VDGSFSGVKAGIVMESKLPVSGRREINHRDTENKKKKYKHMRAK
jgi:hypothetical protein